MLGRFRRTPRSTTALPVVAGYSDFRFIGSGGFSRVYTAWQQRFARTVAIKVITVELSADGLRRFGREQASAGRLDGHPHVIRVYESGTTDAGRPYLTMEYHERGSLADRVRREGPLPVSEALAVGVKLACALDAAHRHGIVHRDVKPQNVLVSPFVGPVLADFGIAAVDDARFDATTGAAFTALHVAPEVLEGLPATPSADLYSLCSTLYELVAGRAPFAAEGDDGLLALMGRVRTGLVPPIDRPGVPPMVADALVDILGRPPDERPSTGMALAERLRELEAAVGSEPTPVVSDGRSAGAAANPPPPPPGAVGPVEPATPSELRSPAPPPPPLAGDMLADTVTRAPAGQRAPAVAPVPPSRAGGWRRLAIAAGVAVAVVAVGTAWWVLDRPSGDSHPAVGEASGVSTTAPGPEAAGADGSLPPCPDPGQVALPDQPLEDGVPPTSLEVEVSGDGTAATLRWDDPNAGRSVYVSFVACDAPEDDDRRVVGVVAPGEPPQLAVEGLSVEFNYCFTVGVLGPDASVTAYRAPGGDSFLCLDQTTS